MNHIYYLTYKIENADSLNYSEILSQAEKWFEYGSIDELLDTLAEGDLLYVDTISSLGKSIKNQVEQYHNIRFIRKVHVILLDNPDLSDATKLHQMNILKVLFLLQNMFIALTEVKR